MGRRAKGEGGLRKRPDGRWEATTTVASGRRKYHYGRTQAEALRKKKRWEAEHRGLDSSEIDDRLTLETWFNHWADTHPKASVETVDGHRSDYRNHLDGPLGNKPIASITAADAEAVYRGMREAGLSARTCRKVHSVLRACLNAAVRHGKLVANPVTQAETPKNTEVADDPVFLERPEANALFDVLMSGGYWYGPAIMLAGTAGIRMSEIRGLRWKWVDLDARELRVRETLSRHRGSWIWKQAKSARSRRDVPLIAPAVEALQAAPEPGPRGVVFPQPGGDEPMSYDALHGQLDRAIVEAGVTRVTLHGLRHTAGSLMLAAGVPIFVVSRILGHADVATTDRIYAHQLKVSARAAMDALEAYMEGGRQ